MMRSPTYFKPRATKSLPATIANWHGGDEPVGENRPSMIDICRWRLSLMPFGDRVQRRAEVHVRRRPMGDEEDIDMVEAKLAEAHVKRLPQGIGGELVVPGGW